MENFYDNATRKLLRTIDTMNLSQDERTQTRRLTLQFRNSFKLETVKHATFAVDIGDSYKLFPYDSYGFCRAACFSFVSLMKSPDWRLMYIDELWTYGPHFFVQHLPSRTIFDLTFDQYTYEGINIPYNLGRPSTIDVTGQKVVTRFLRSSGTALMSALQHNQSKE